MSLICRSTLSSLSQQVGKLSLGNSRIGLTRHPANVAPAFSTSTLLSSPAVVPSNLFESGRKNEMKIFTQATRTMVTKKKKQMKKLKAQKREQKERLKASEGEETAAPQHEAWVDFQKDISVDGFQTGQVTVSKVSKKTKSGHQVRELTKTQQREMVQTDGREIADVRGGHLPFMRYSDEETAELLAKAYAAIPERAGKRGTRNLNRQKRRWFLVRKIRSKEKRYRIREHEARMEKRSRRMKEIQQIKLDAPDQREKDRDYQISILTRWADIMSISKDTEADTITAANEDTSDVQQQKQQQ